MTMLIKYDTFSEDVTRFYIAECVLAIEAVHRMGFIHRYVFSGQVARRFLTSTATVISNRIISSCRLSRSFHNRASYTVHRDKEGHIKLSDFGLSTGFHKHHDSNYYQRLLESAKNANGTKAAARNSVMVNSINLTISNKDQIATWKANRRKLVGVTSHFPKQSTDHHAGVLDCRHSRLHCARDFSSKRLW